MLWSLLHVHINRSVAYLGLPIFLFVVTIINLYIISYILNLVCLVLENANTFQAAFLFHLKVDLVKCVLLESIYSQFTFSLVSQSSYLIEVH